MAAVECVVIGAGVVGLACARKAARQGMEVVVLEAQKLIGSVTSARNSEVVHAGIYYPPGSLKAAMCVDGREQLYAYCEAHNVPHNRCGKLIVATSPAEVATLQAIMEKARVNGVMDLQVLTRKEALALEPALRCDAALLSPSTGIVDSHAFMQALQGDAEEAGAAVAFDSPVAGGHVLPGGHGQILLRVGTDGGAGDVMELQCKHVINAAGLTAPWLARMLLDSSYAAEHLGGKGAGAIGGGDAGATAAAETEQATTYDLGIPTASFAKGNYYTLQGAAPFSRLIYPVPQLAGLGVHATIDLGGSSSFQSFHSFCPPFLNYAFFFV